MAFLAILGYCCYNILAYEFENKKTNDTIEKVNEISGIDESNNKNDNEDIKKDYDIDFEGLKKVNSDLVGYLIVPNTPISQAVVKGNNNDFYLKHNFYKQYDIAGWLFADYENKFDGADKNIVIYGHNMKTGTMFGSLKNLLKKEWYRDDVNKYITFITEKETEIYEVFSVYVIESEDYYRRVSFDENYFENFIQTIKKRSQVNFDNDVFETDNVLTLSTCYSDNRYRVVIHSKKIN